MPYIDRDEHGKIIGSYAEPQFPGQEFIPDTDAEYQARLNPPASLHDRMKAILLTLDASVQAQFGQAAAAVDLAIQNGRPDVAKLELQGLTLPSELESIRTAMIQEIDNG